MQKLFFTSLIACCMILSSHAFGQSIYYQVGITYYPGNGACQIQTTNVGITTTQTISPGVVKSWTNIAPGGYFTNPIGAFTYGAYWVTPALFNPMTISINSGYTAEVQNLSGTPSRVRMAVVFYTGGLKYEGPQVTIPGNSTATVSIPGCGYTYTATPSNPSGGPVPVILALEEY
jgi:hypothetical protein